MKRTSAQLKQIARAQLTGHYGIPIGAMVVSALIQSGLLLPFYFTLNIQLSVRDLILYNIAAYVILQVISILSAGLLRIHLALARGETPVFSELFSCFKKRPDRFILNSLIQSLIPFAVGLAGMVCIRYSTFSPNSTVLLLLGLLLLLVEIIVKLIITLHVMLAEFLLAEHDAMEVPEAFRQSFSLMAGNKSRLFYIILSFIGWELLSLLSCNLGALWIAPYQSQTFVAFYLDVTKRIPEGPAFQERNEHVEYRI